MVLQPSLAGGTHFGKHLSLSMFKKEEVILEKSTYFAVLILTHGTLINSTIKDVESAVQGLEDSLRTILHTGGHLQDEQAKTKLSNAVELTASKIDACVSSVKLGKTEVLKNWESI